MSEEIFPAAIVNNSQESNFSRHNIRLRVMNWVILVWVISCLVVLPFIKVDIGLRGFGMIRPVTELVQLTSPVSGNLTELRITENLPVKKGDTVAIIDAPQHAEQLRYISQRKAQLITHLDDLQLLLALDLSQLEVQPGLQSEKYVHSFLQLYHNLSNLQREIDHQQRELDRQQLLMDRDLASRVQYEDTEYQYQQAVTGFTIAVQQQKNRWQSELIETRTELKEQEFQFRQLQEELDLYTIRTPVSGTIQNLAPVQTNSFIYPNQVLGEITPDTSLVAAVFIDPKDIGLLKTGMPVKLQIDAFNQNDWGTLDGTIIDISGDILMADQSPVYRVLCSLSKSYLTLSNGTRGELKKGMSLQARFILTERSLFQLLFDNIDDWLNPFWNKQNQFESIAGR